MKILIAPDKFKNVNTSQKMAELMRNAIQKQWPEALIRLCPLADGGDGTLNAVVYSLKGKTVIGNTFNPLMKPIQAPYGLTQLPEKNSALVEMSQASGLSLLIPAERNPMKTTTYGTGKLVVEAVLQGCGTIRVTLGGSASVDGGMGFLQALGAVIQTRSGTVPSGASGRSLSQVTDIDLAPAQILLKNSTLVGLIDAQVPLLGPLGAARLYAPQKGASPSEVEELEMGLAHFERILSMTCGKSFAQELGVGAAGGLGLAIRALGGTLENGFGFVSGTLKLAEQIKDCDLILTGEGKLDESSRQGKVTVGVARLAKAAGKPCVAIVGALEPDLPWLKEEGFSKVIPLFDTPFTAPDDPRKEQVPQRLIEAIGKLLAGAQRIYS